MLLYSRYTCYVFLYLHVDIFKYIYKSVELGNQLCFISNCDWLNISLDLWSWTSLPLGEWFYCFPMMIFSRKSLRIGHIWYGDLKRHTLYYRLYTLYYRFLYEGPYKCLNKKENCVFQALQEWGQSVWSFSPANPRRQTVWICW